MSRPARITQADVREAAARGWTAAQAAEHYGVGPEYVRKRARQAGVRLRNPIAIDRQARRDVLNLAALGVYTVREIAAECGVSPSAVQKIITTARRAA